MNDIRQVCTACNGSGRLLRLNDHFFPAIRYKPHPKLPCTVCKGYGYIRPMDDAPPPIQQDLLSAVGKTRE